MPHGLVGYSVRLLLFRHRKVLSSILSGAGVLLRPRALQLMGVLLDTLSFFLALGSMMTREEWGSNVDCVRGVLSDYTRLFRAYRPLYICCTVQHLMPMASNHCEK